MTDFSGKSLTRLLVAMALAFPMTACERSIGSSEPPNFEPLPERFKRPCAGPSDIPNRETNEAEEVQLWASDRTNLANCRDLHDQTVAWVEERDRGLSGK